MQSRAKTVPAYLEEVPGERRAVMRKLRALIRKAAPRAAESMRYGMPTYELGGELFCAFASQKGYLALYLCDTQVVARFRSELGTTNCGKGCIRYRNPEILPLDVIERLLRAVQKGKQEGGSGG